MTSIPTMHIPLSRLGGAFAMCRGAASRMSVRMSSGLPCPSVVLNDGRLHPQIGFGTYKVGFIPASASAAAAGDEASGSQQASASSIVGEALACGYRFLDCAQFYGNEADVGAAIAASGVDRSELYLASKCWSDAIYAGRGAVRAQIERSLKELGTDYLDLYLVHWPVPTKHVAAYLELQAAQ